MVSSDLRKEVGWTKLEFPAPLEVWVVSYVLATVATIATLGVSVPSRGMGGFLLKSLDLKQRPLLKVSVPSRGMGGFLRT